MIQWLVQIEDNFIFRIFEQIEDFTKGPLFPNFSYNKVFSQLILDVLVLSEVILRLFSLFGLSKAPSNFEDKKVRGQVPLFSDFAQMASFWFST